MLLWIDSPKLNLKSARFTKIQNRLKGRHKKEGIKKPLKFTEKLRAFKDKKLRDH
jgi:hypothetical protein